MALWYCKKCKKTMKTKVPGICDTCGSNCERVQGFANSIFEHEEKVKRPVPKPIRPKLKIGL